MTQKNTFTVCGDYSIPDIQLANEGTTHLGKYGRLRKDYLQKIFPHLIDVDTTARARIERIIQGLLEVNPAPDKYTKQMDWVQHMNTLKVQAEEIVMAELIYC